MRVCINTIHCYLLIYILDYDFERLFNTQCSHGKNSFETLEHAKDNCKANGQCIGVFQKNCTDDKKYYECSKNATIISNIQIEGCIYKKFSIGK